MSEYKISVILAVYNVENYIEQAFQSLLQQTIGFSNLQIIFADDHSTDQSRNIVQKYTEQYENVCAVYLADNSGACGKPRNEGMKLAAGKYVMFLDPDDLYEPKACEILYQEMEQGAYSCAAGYYKEINEDGELITENVYQSMDIRPGIYELPGQIDAAIQIRSGLWAKIYRRDLMEHAKLKALEGVPGQDMVFYMEYILASKNMKYVDEPIVLYRIRDKKDKSVSFLYNRWFFDGINQSYRRCLEIFRDANLEKKFDLLFAGALNYYMQSMIDSKLASEEIAEILAAWDWAFAYDKENSIKENEVWYAPVKRFLVQKKYDSAAHILCNMRSLRAWVLSLKEAIAFYQQQEEKMKEAITWHQQQEERMNGILAEQKGWTAQLEEARDFFKTQTENMQKAYEDACAQKETAFLEMHALQKINEENETKMKQMQLQTEETLERYEEAEMEGKKWKYKYHRLMEDKRIEKIAKKKGLTI